jgi:hypothetical protein
LIGGVDVAIGELKIRRTEALLNAELEALAASLWDVGEEAKVLRERAADQGAPSTVVANELLLKGSSSAVELGRDSAVSNQRALSLSRSGDGRARARRLSGIPSDRMAVPTPSATNLKNL